MKGDIVEMEIAVGRLRNRVFYTVTLLEYNNNPKDVKWKVLGVPSRCYFVLK